MTFSKYSKKCLNLVQKMPTYQKLVTNYKFIYEVIKLFRETSIQTQINSVLCEKDESKMVMDPFLNDNYFISSKIRNYAESAKLDCRKYVHENVIIYYYDDRVNQVNINRIKALLHICRFFEIFSKMKKQVNIVILNSKFKKKLGRPPLSVDNINTGSSISGSRLYIWRKEEQLKVLFHELIHYYDLEFHNDVALMSYLKNVVYAKFASRDFNLKEAYTESLAITLHTIYVSYKLKLNIIELFQAEVKFNMIQVSKLMNYYSSPNIITLSNRIDNETSIFSYFVLRLYFIYNYDKLLDYYYRIFFDNNFASLSLDVILRNAMNDDTLNVWLEKIVRSRSEQNSIQESFRKYIWNNLRMTCLELDP